jgi:hypothetical protein
MAMGAFAFEQRPGLDPGDTHRDQPVGF